MQVLTLCMVSLTKSCLRAIDCTEDPDLRLSTLDVMPDVMCEGTTFYLQATAAGVLLFVYDLLIPLLIADTLHSARTSGQIYNLEFREKHGWYLRKYHADAWYAELVFVLYRIVMSSCAVLLSSRANASLCLALMGLVTATMLKFVLTVKPFKDDDDDDDHLSALVMTSADRKQAWALAATMAATMVGFGCAQTKNRGDIMDAAIATLISCIGVTPILVGLYEKYKDHKAKQKGNIDDEQDSEGVDENHDKTENPVLGLQAGLL